MIAGREQYIIDLASALLQVDSDALVQGFADSDTYIATLEEFFTAAGRLGIIIANQILPSPDPGKKDSLKLKSF